MIFQNDFSGTITCKECVKRDVCQYKKEFEQTKIEVKNIKGTPLSPIKISVSCTAAVKDNNVNLREFKREYECEWIGQSEDHSL